MSDEPYRFGRYRQDEQQPPEPRQVTDQVVMRFDDIYEVDPRRMTRFRQQKMPAWDSHRIAAARMDHLRYVQRAFADETLTADCAADPIPADEPDKS
ncbi:hypothetical protein [Thermocrispum agreste]|uniref:hypothetical protein n=1 Tax=Thermocrispum agreste TaxID=37925 RepID=UPI000686D3F1|nr:hypothetical protein [Thermocrispum agreste]